MDNLIGKKVIISGMTLEVTAEQDDSWQCQNITTKEVIYFKKSMLENAIKLAKAEILPVQDK